MIFVWLALGAVVAAMVIAGVKYRPGVWQWLFVLELFLLLWAFGNCFVPGSWRTFWEFEIPLAVLAVCTAIPSALLQVRDTRKNRHWAFLPPMVALCGVAFLVAVIIVSH